jgi:hypothetical protein
MVDENPTILLGDASGERVAIRPTGRTHPEVSDCSDGNWIDCSVEIRAGGFEGRYVACFRSEDFRDWRDAIDRVVAERQGVAWFTTLENQLTLAVTLNERGHVRVDATARDEPWSRNELKFALRIDQTYLRPLIRALDELLREYPVGRSPDA